MRLAKDSKMPRAAGEHAAELLAAVHPGNGDGDAKAPLDENALDNIVNMLLALVAQRGPSGPNLKKLMEVVEQSIILRVLWEFRWHQARAAEFLGLRPQTLSEKIKRFDRGQSASQPGFSARPQRDNH